MSEGFVLEDAIASIAGLAPVILFLSEVITKLIKKWFDATVDGVWAWSVSLFSGIGITELLSHFQLGMFASPVHDTLSPYISAAIVGAIATLVANAVFSLDIAKSLLSFTKVRVPVTKKDK